MFSRVYPAWLCRPVLQGGPGGATPFVRPPRRIFSASCPYRECFSGQGSLQFPSFARRERPEGEFAMPDQKVIRSLPTILERLHATYPDARYELNWETPLQLLVATILAAQCTDERVNRVTPG